MVNMILRSRPVKDLSRLLSVLTHCRAVGHGVRHARHAHWPPIALHDEQLSCITACSPHVLRHATRAMLSNTHYVQAPLHEQHVWPSTAHVDNAMPQQ